MVEFSATQLDLAFAALADPTRRAIVDRLASVPDLSVSELAAPFAVSLPAVMKHLDVLARANLIERHKTGRTVRCRLQPGPMEAAMLWLARYERFWSEGLDRLAAFVEEEEPCLPKPAPNLPPGQASPSSAGLRPRRRRSTKPGRTPRN
jgi:DNA-binding transcriptional ArsR family regulator